MYTVVDRTIHDRYVQVETKKYNLESFMQESTRFLYKLRLANKLAYIRRDNVSAETLYEQTKQCIHEAAEEALGQQDKQTTEKPEWWSENLKNL